MNMSLTRRAARAPGREGADLLRFQYKKLGILMAGGIALQNACTKYIKWKEEGK